ncbi:hypothetical protein KC361_g108 [Hortaea werneckii]|nr:hypothetical protein KC361_g108 [Hortaea werneckii]
MQALRLLDVEPTALSGVRLGDLASRAGGKRRRRQQDGFRSSGKVVPRMHFHATATSHVRLHGGHSKQDIETV